MQTMRDKWTDERLDDLNAKVDRGFERTGTDIRELRAEMNARFDAMDRKFDAMDRKFDAVDRKFDATNRTIEATNRTIEGLTRMILWFAGALIVAMVASFLAATLAS